MSDLVHFAPVRAWDRNGVYAPGALAKFYEPGTSTPRTVYSDIALTTAHDWPLVADASGCFAPVYTSSPVKVVLTDADGVALPKGTMDPAFVIPATAAAASGVSFAPTGEIPVITVQDAIERVQTNIGATLDALGIGLTSATPLLASFDATNIPSGALYRFDMASTAGTAPADWGAAEVGTFWFDRVATDSGVAFGVSLDDGNLWHRVLSTGAWGSWVQKTYPVIAQSAWNDGTSTIEGPISPAKCLAASRQVFQVSDQKASGTQGGGSTAATWITRTLNTEDIAGVSGASLAANVVTLPSGLYEVEIHAPGYGASSHKIRLYSVTGSATLLVGTSENSNASNPDTVKSFIRGVITLSVETEVRVEHWFTSTLSTWALGRAAASGEVEIYTVARFTRISGV